ncbi:Succinyl-CoA--L-malate CoA-transferase beta subunit [Usitatibacter rugosus]|uniref:Succinyl-CoA--L-malate CoA-transferase beta subunit n=1 Tax=Usitatibacter rugosus TaxID=2732067 RepID=A0A6M4H0X6_9PROT|nr:CaiB/BaiF CoA-transferase family protein [Usitatibacter rugosus]QJR13159.1 Succinyl-CoA--L-malate CoA-transferase beta subunit [Usitatibacter rugosus]
MGPLADLKVVELGTLIAGPYCARLMAEFGADVVKVETPGEGDPLRKWRKLHEGNSLWWYAQARNKKSVAVNLKAPEGQEVVRRLVAQADIVVENFRPGTLEKWNLGYEQLAKENPRLVMVRLSGFGQTGPYKDQPGFGAIGESMGGMRYITGYPDRAPVRVGISIGDSLAAMFGVIGALMAIHNRTKTGKGQVVDVALYEAVFAMMESMLPEYGYDGSVRERTGSALPGIVPSNTYRCKDGQYVVIGANADSIFKRMMRGIGLPALADDPELADNAGRTRHTERLDKVIGDWCASVTLDEALAVLAKAEVPSGRIYSIADIAKDLHFQARGMIERHKLGERELVLPGIVPKLSETPGGTKWIGPRLGEHTDEVLASLGYSAADIARLHAAATVG